MKTQRFVELELAYARSVHLEREAASAGSGKPYIPTARALATLARVLDGATAVDGVRAWSLVGPYGSGKSSFAAFLSGLLEPVSSPRSKAARALLRARDSAMERRVRTHLSRSPGYCRVLLTGTPEPMARRLVKALHAGAAAFWAHRRGRPPAIVAELERAVSKDAIEASHLFELVARLRQALTRAKGAGLLIAIDELGKFLEYEARHHGANDIYLLQALAESSQREGEVPLVLVVLLHQSIDQYARGLSRTLRNEWLKVQGRFETVPFLDSTEQILRVVAAAMRHHLPAKPLASIERQSKRYAAHLAEARALPRGFSKTVAADLFARCYPLHPVAALVLPTLCYKAAQNERTLFSYLGSHEPHGFLDTVQRLEPPRGYVHLWDIYDYFIANQPAVTSDPAVHRRWAEVTTALERIGDGSESETRLLKAVGLLNLLGPQGGLRASMDILSLLDGSAADTTACIESLASRSVIQFRQFNQEYRVWQGSDFDLESAVQETYGAVVSVDLAETLNHRRKVPPVVARRASIESGTLRYFEPAFLSAGDVLQLGPGGQLPRLLIALAEAESSAADVRASIGREALAQDVVALVTHAGLLREAVTESLALERVRVERQELNGDPVAQRELQDRLDASLAREEELVSELFTDPGRSEWYWRGERLEVSDRKRLQRELSRVAESVYHGAPQVRNELINRDNPSAQANAARNKLLFALVSHRAEDGLGFEKFPAERSLYLALLRESGLHRRSKDGWILAAPDEKDPLRFDPVWGALDAFLESTESEAKSFVAIADTLTAPPYGVKRGVLPILWLVYYMANEDEIALYENRMYVPHLTDAHIERFARRPQDFEVQRFRIEGVRATLFREYESAFFSDRRPSRTVLSLARPLVQFIGELPEYTRATSNLSPATQRVRDALLYSKSPERLLFEDLPQACGLSSRDSATSVGLGDAVRECLRELKYAFPRLLDDQRSLFCRTLQLSEATELTELRRVLPGRLGGLDKYTIDSEGLRAFIRRAVNEHDDDETWFRNLLVFLGRKPVEKWTDADHSAAELRLKEFARRINDLRKLQVHYADVELRTGATTAEVVLLRAVSTRGHEADEAVVISDEYREATAGLVKEVLGRLEQLSNRELRLAVLAQAVQASMKRPTEDAPDTPCVKEVDSYGT